jgi:hypothetical protein
MLDIVFVDLLSHHVLRLYALLGHFVLTVMLLWTKIDSIQTDIFYDDSARYKDYYDIYEGMIVSGIIMLMARGLFLALEGNRVTLWGALILGLDLLACFFLAWINLDGLVWNQYGYIYGFCVLLPLLYEIVYWLNQYGKKAFMQSTSPVSILKRIWFFFEQHTARRNV